MLQVSQLMRQVHQQMNGRGVNLFGDLFGNVLILPTPKK